MPGIAPSQTVEAAFQLLDVVAAHRAATLTQIAQAASMTTSKTHRLLRTLEASGYVAREAGKTYVLGPKLLYLGHRLARGHPLLRAAAPALDELSGTTGETALLAIRFGTERLIVDSRDSRFGPQAAWPHDARLPLHSGALGICLLSYAPSETLDALLARSLDAYTSSTITQREALEHAIRRVHERGCYVSRGTYQEGVYSVAAPVLGGQRQGVAAVAVVGSTARLDDAREARYAETVREAASNIARYLT